MTQMQRGERPGRVAPPAAGRERRRSRRIVVAPGKHLPVVIRCGQGQVWQGRVVNVSSSGMLVEFPKGQIPSVHTHAKVSVKLQYLGDCIWLPGQVRHAMGRKIGFCFHDLLEHPRGKVKHPLSLVLQSLSRVVSSPKLRSI